MKKIPIIWLIFGVLFLCLSIFHFSLSTKSISELKINERPGSGSGGVSILGSGVDQPLKDFSKGFNDYLVELNGSNKWINIVAGIGYVLAAFTAFYSCWLSKK